MFWQWASITWVRGEGSPLTQMVLPPQTVWQCESRVSTMDTLSLCVYRNREEIEGKEREMWEKEKSGSYLCAVSLLLHAVCASVCCVYVVPLSFTTHSRCSNSENIPLPFWLLYRKNWKAYHKYPPSESIIRCSVVTCNSGENLFGFPSRKLNYQRLPSVSGFIWCLWRNLKGTLLPPSWPLPLGRSPPPKAERPKKLKNGYQQPASLSGQLLHQLHHSARVLWQRGHHHYWSATSTCSDTD